MGEGDSEMSGVCVQRNKMLQARVVAGSFVIPPGCMGRAGDLICLAHRPTPSDNFQLSGSLKLVRWELRQGLCISQSFHLKLWVETIVKRCQG